MRKTGLTGVNVRVNHPCSMMFKVMSSDRKGKVVIGLPQPGQDTEPGVVNQLFSIVFKFEPLTT